MIAVVDFGSQTAHLIVRRFKDAGVAAKLVDPSQVLGVKEAVGIVLSGGPGFVNQPGAPMVHKKLFDRGIPILGICYGLQATAHLLGGRVEGASREYGPTSLRVNDFHDLFYGLPEEFKVWESHGDSVVKLPRGFKVMGSTNRVKVAAVKHVAKKIWGVQFHPEVSHTNFGGRILVNFATRICGLGLQPKRLQVKELIEEIKTKVGPKQVIGAVSGGTDSTVAGVLVAKAVGKQFIPIFVDSGLMRREFVDRAKIALPKILGLKVKIVDAKREFLQVLVGVTDPEEKRKAIGKLYIQIFERELRRYPQAKYLLQGTTYADFIQAEGRGGKHSALIKSHHNVGGLPRVMKLKLLEPLRFLYTDQVRQLGKQLGVVAQQPFPGPGFAVRIMGEVTQVRVDRVRQADAIVVEVLRQRGWYDKVFQCWAVLTGVNSTGVKGDLRFYGEVVVVRAVKSRDRMTADWVRLPGKILEELSTRIVNEVPGVARVVYDITTKPPGTMEWE